MNMAQAVLRGWILYTGKEIVELKRACEEARAVGVHLDIVAPKDVALVLDPARPNVIFRNGAAEPLPMFAIAAFVDEPDAYNLALLEQLETQGVLCVNRAASLRVTGDKLLTLQRLAKANIPVPKTILVHRNIAPSTICERLGLPLVVKVIDGSKGHGVTLVRTGEELETLLEMLDAARCQGALLAQEFIRDSRGRDLRVLVIDGQPRFAMLRSNATPEGFKSNVSAGGLASAWPMTDAIRDLSERVIRALNLDLGGIDLLFQGDGFVVGEVNSIPGFQGIESCGEINVPAEVLRSIGKRLQARVKLPLDELHAKSAQELLPLFMRACSAPEEVQRHVLLDIVGRSRDTVFGRAHGFAQIESIEAYRRHVSVNAWEVFESYAQRVEAGEKDVLFAGVPKHFVLTSGTTGAMKRLPESREGDYAKSVTSRVRIAALMRLLPDGAEGYFLPLSNQHRSDQTASGIPIDYASGLSLAGLPPQIQKRIAYPAAVLKAASAPSLQYLIMRHALALPNVLLLAGNNPARMTSLFEWTDEHRDELIADIERGVLSDRLELDASVRESLARDLAPDPARAAQLRELVARDGHLRPKGYWPDLKMVACWLGGTIGRYVKELRPWLPATTNYVDCGYGASEGKFNVILKPETSAGPLALFGGFYEFQPITGGAPLLAHELSDGQEYELIVTNYSGLYRYALQDVVRVQGFTGKTPNIFFVNKSVEVANLAAEKISGAVLADLIGRVLADAGLRGRHFCVTTDADRHRYDFCIEPEGQEAPNAHWLAAMEQALRSASSPYDVLRNQRILHPPRLLVMKSGWRDHLFALRTNSGASANQVKLPVVSESEPEASWIAHIETLENEELSA